jgi:hypothetical protein
VLRLLNLPDEVVREGLKLPECQRLFDELRSLEVRRVAPRYAYMTVLNFHARGREHVGGGGHPPSPRAEEGQVLERPLRRVASARYARVKPLEKLGKR